MYYVQTVRAAERTIKRNSQQKGLVEKGDRPGPHLLWMCREVRRCPIDQIWGAAKALDLVKAITSGVYEMGWWSEVGLSQRLVDADRQRGYDKPHPWECLAIDQHRVIRLRDEKDRGYFAPNALEVISRLLNERFDENVWVFNRHSPPDVKTHQAAMEKKGLFSQTGITNYVCYTGRMATVRWCQIRKVTHYIGKRNEVLNFAGESGVSNLISFQPDPDEGISLQAGLCATIVQTWKQIETVLLDTPVAV